MKETIRMATKEDAKRIWEIYEPFILHTAITFEYAGVTYEDMKARIQGILQQYPWLVYELDTTIAGYAYGSPFFTRSAYSWDCQTSIYIDPNYQGLGIGSKLYTSLLNILKKQGYYNVYALISLPNESSISFHKKNGFKQNGTLKKTGYKFNQWHDVIIMSKLLAPLPEHPTPIVPISALSITNNSFS